MIILKLIKSPKERQQFLFLPSFSFLTCFRVEIDISYHIHKIRLKCEIFSRSFVTYNMKERSKQGIRLQYNAN